MKYLEGILIRDDPGQGATLSQDIEFSQAVLAKAGDGRGSKQGPFCALKSRAAIEAETTDKAGAEICIEIGTLNDSYCCSSIDVASCDGAGTVVVRIVDNRQRECSIIAVGGWVKTGRSFHEPPAVIESASSIGALRHVDLLSGLLADVSDIQISSIKRKSPGIPQPLAPHQLIPSAEEKWIDGSTCAGCSWGRRIDPEKFSQPASEILSIVARVP